jgi:hypothetical protein
MALLWVELRPWVAVAGFLLCITSAIALPCMVGAQDKARRAAARAEAHAKQLRHKHVSQSEI